MGMFDHFSSEIELPFIPTEIFSKIYKLKDIFKEFQTKDTPNQGMSYYRVNSKGILQELIIEGTWSKGKGISKKEKNWGKIMDAMPKFTETSRKWIKCCYSGSINFYSSFMHPKNTKINFKNEEFTSHKYGWIEFQAMFQNGTLIVPITLFEFKNSIKYSNKELDKMYKQRIEYKNKKY